MSKDYNITEYLLWYHNMAIKTWSIFYKILIKHILGQVWDVSCEFKTLRPGQMAAILQMTLSNTFSWMKMLEFRLEFHWFVPKGPINNIPALV